MANGNKVSTNETLGLKVESIQPDDTWEEASQSNVVKLEKGEVLIGRLVSVEPSNSFEGSYAITVENEENGLQMLFVSNIVVDLITKHSIAKDDLVAIKYLGLVQNKAKTREYKDYEVRFKRN